MTTKEAEHLGELLATLVQAGSLNRAFEQLTPILTERTPFRLLDRIGQAIGSADSETVNKFLERIAAKKTEGGWVVIASALEKQLDCDPTSAYNHCRKYIIAADVWYGADIFGERVPGPALVNDVPSGLQLLSPWREDENRWVRRAVGVAAHFWAKRSRGVAELASETENLLTFLEPMFSEWEIDVVKGVGWGLKTLGRYYPGLMVDWLPKQLHRRHRALMVRKALTYFSEEQREQVTKAACSLI